MSKEWLNDKTEELLQHLEKQSNEYLQGFYDSANATNPYNFFNDYVRHFDFDIGNQSIHRKFYRLYKPF